MSDDPSLHPKFNPVLGRIERRGRPRKITAIEDEGSQEAREQNKIKSDECMAVIERNFGDIGSFLECWDSIKSKERTAFIQNKSSGLISKWLAEITTTGSAVTEAIINTCVKEIKGIIESKECPLRHVQQTSSNMCNRLSLHGSITSNLDDMRLFLEYHAPLSWGVMRALAQGSIDKRNTGLCTLSAFATILNCRN